jgi:hypothetical protein
MNLLTLLLQNQSQPTLTLTLVTTYSADTSIEIAGPEKHPFYNVYWLQKNMKNTE